MPRVHSPKRGSRSFSPRKRSRTIAGRIKFWPKIIDGPKLLGFAGYKAGMIHVFLIEDRDRSPDYGKEIKNAVTIIDTPPINIVALRAYRNTNEGLNAITEIWTENIPVDLLRRVKTFNLDKKENNLDKIEAHKEDIAQIRVLAATQPRLTTVSKKKPELFEIAVGGGTLEEQINYARELLGNSVKVSDVFKAGEVVDTIGVTKGKGFQGPVKRWGIRILQRKSRKTKRGVASIGPWRPRRVMPTVPRAGQMGLHHRTEFNKRILIMGDNGEQITPKSGFNRYGKITENFIVLKGSVMGPPKRLIKIRKAVRKSKYPEEAPQITYVNTDFSKKHGD